MTTRTGIFSKTLTAVLGLALVLSLVSATSQAQDNPLPLNYRNLTVIVKEVRGNQNYSIGSAKVTINPQKPKNAAYSVKFPQQKTTRRNSGEARFSKIPLSKEVGTYTIVVEAKGCIKKLRGGKVEKNKTTIKNYSKNGSSDQRKLVTFDACGKAAERYLAENGKGRDKHKKGKGYDEHKDDKNYKGRKDQKRKGHAKHKGYKLDVSLKQHGQPGRGLWVYLYNPDGKRIERKRASHKGEVSFWGIPADKGYTIEVRYGSRKTLLKEKFNMPKKDETLRYTLK